MNNQLPVPGNGGSPPNPSAILLVEDAHVIRDLYCTTLLDAGYRVHPVGDAAGAKIIVIGGVPLHLLLTDYSMPGLNGAQLGRWFQQQRPGIPVVVMSASVQSVQAASRELPNVLCFLKPATPQALLGIVRNALEGPAPASGVPRTR